MKEESNDDHNHLMIDECYLRYQMSENVWYASFWY